MTLIERPNQSCGNCNAFVRDAPKGRTAGDSQGTCHADAPHAFPVMVQLPGSALHVNGPHVAQGIQGCWPPVKMSEWCRRWSYRGEAKGMSLPALMDAAE